MIKNSLKIQTQITGHVSYRGWRFSVSTLTNQWLFVKLCDPSEKKKHIRYYNLIINKKKKRNNGCFDTLQIFSPALHTAWVCWWCTMAHHGNHYYPIADPRKCMHYYACVAHKPITQAPVIISWLVPSLVFNNACLFEPPQSCKNQSGFTWQWICFLLPSMLCFDFSKAARKMKRQHSACPTNSWLQFITIPVWQVW